MTLTKAKVEKRINYSMDRGRGDIWQPKEVTGRDKGQSERVYNVGEFFASDLPIAELNSGFSELENLALSLHNGGVCQ